MRAGAPTRPSEATGGSGGLVRPYGASLAVALGVYEPGNGAERPEVRLRDLVLRDGAPELALQELHELDHPDRVDHAAAEQRRVVLQRPVRAHVEEVFAHVRARTVRDRSEERRVGKECF